MDARLQELLDHHEIRQVLNRYCQGCDRLDAERLATVFHSDSWVDHAADHCPGREYVETTMDQVQAHLSMASHLQGQSQIEVNGDEAGSETYFFCAMKAAADPKLLTFMGGRYVDTFAKEAGQWKIKKRVCVRDWSMTQRVEQDFLEAQPFIDGSWSGSDPSYELLGIKHSGPHLIPA